MKVNYSDQEVIKEEKAIFLAGPTPRSIDVTSWRPEAVKILEELGFDGVIYYPELEHDNRSFDYTNQVWWEREALYNADIVLFWIPRNMKDMPALTTNVEYGYWLGKNSDKVVYGRPDASEKNRYLDWLYKTETGEYPSNTLKGVCERTLFRMETIKDKNKDIDSYELNIIKRLLTTIPELKTLVSDVYFTPESFGTTSDKKTYGQILFPNVDPNQLKEFDRTILSVLLYYYIKDNRYEKFVEQQSGANKLTREKFAEIRKFMLTNFDTKAKEYLLLYYMIINDLGKSQIVIDQLKEKGIESVDHDLLLEYLFEYNMLDTVSTFSAEQKNSLNNVLKHGINVGQFIQGESVDYSVQGVKELNDFERSLMMAEAMLDIGGVLGHINNQQGSAVLTQSTVDNLLTASSVLANISDEKVLFNEFLSKKADNMDITTRDQALKKCITRICLMMRLWKKEDIETVENEIVDNVDNYRILINEFNETGYNGYPAILLYYSPALLSNACGYYRKNGSQTPINDTLKICIPFMQKILVKARDSFENNKDGVITIMLRDAAIVASQDPIELRFLDMNVLDKEEGQVVKVR